MRRKPSRASPSASAEASRSAATGIDASAVANSTFGCDAIVLRTVTSQCPGRARCFGKTGASNEALPPQPRYQIPQQRCFAAEEMRTAGYIQPQPCPGALIAVVDLRPRRVALGPARQTGKAAKIGGRIVLDNI